VREALQSGGQVRVETRPKGATVLLDGKVVGEAPLTIDDVSYERRHRLEARLDGYLAETVALPTDRPPLHVVKLRLSRGGKVGRVALLTHPSSEVWLDNKRLGPSSHEPLSVPVGEHEVRFVVPGLGVDVTYHIEVPEQGQARYYFDLTSSGER
jgi:hypothetical protein